MRQIEFRGFRTDGKGWAYGSLICPHAGNESTYIIGWNGADFEVRSETMGQFTGLYDRNGVKVFEGDVVTWPDLGPDYPIYTVYYNSNEAHFYCKKEGVKEECYLDSTHMKVVGNIHETTSEQ